MQSFCGCYCLIFLVIMFKFVENYKFLQKNYYKLKLFDIFFLHLQRDLFAIPTL